MSSSFETIYKKLQNGSDVRGSAIATETEPLNLTGEIAAEIAASFVAFMEKRTGKARQDLRLGVGHDSRLTADIMKAGVLAGFAGAQGFDCGLVTTPAMFISTVLPESNFDGAVMITASHLPFNRNGLKFFTREGGLEKADITEILKGAAELHDAGLTPKAEGITFPAFDLVTLYSNHTRSARTSRAAAISSRTAISRTMSRIRKIRTPWPPSAKPFLLPMRISASSSTATATAARLSLRTGPRSTATRSSRLCPRS